MPQPNFMAADLAACALAFAVFFLLALVPGYVLGWWGNLLEFRRQRGVVQAALSIPLSISLCPIVDYLLGRWFSVAAVWAFYGLLWFAFLCLAREWLRAARRPQLSRAEAMLAVTAAVVTVTGLLVLIDIQWQNRLYFPIVSYDYTLRSAFTSAITRTGIPPLNPYFFPGRGFPARYHYFWLILCSLADQLGGAAVSPRQALIGGTLWCGLGLLCLPPLYLRFFQSRGTEDLGRRSLIAVALFGVTGLDIIPNLLLASRGLVLPEMEWWNEQVTSWVGSVLWVPHHISALIACLTGFLVVWDAAGKSSPRRQVTAALGGGLAFATAAGTSVYVTLVFAAFLGLWVLIVLVRRWYREAWLWLGAGTVTVLLAFPFLRELTAGSGSGGAFVRPTVRMFLVTRMLESLHHNHTWPVLGLNLVFLPLNYFLELGIFFVLGLWQVRGCRGHLRELPRPQLAVLLLAGTSVGICTFLRSNVISGNDLGWRGFLPAQFVLLLWATEFLAAWPARREGSRAPRVPSRAGVAVLLVLGAAGSLYEVGLLRFYPMLMDAGKMRLVDWLSPDRKLGQRTLALRRMYEALGGMTPVQAVIQHNPDRPGDDLFSGLYANRQTAAAARGCGTVFGGDTGLCGQMFPKLSRIFEGAPEAEARQACRAYAVDVLLFKDSDPAWRDRSSWIWKSQPLAANEYAKAFACRSR